MSRRDKFLAASLALVAALSIGLATPAWAQCLLANPSFELPGAGGAVFAGWNQFGVVASEESATHGSVSARLTGPNLGGWDLSACWQRLETAPGEQWSVRVRGWHSAAQPLTGDSRAIVNVEWRDSAGTLLSYENYTIADPSTPVDEVQTLEIVTPPAPEGAVATHLLLGTLQGPGDPVPEASFDDVIFEMTGPPTPDELQWNDFPGGRSLDFSGRSWRVKGPGFYGPGPNNFCDGPECTWVDGNGRLHMRLHDDLGYWASSEIVLEEALGYGDYVFTTVGRLDTLDPDVILGLFLWQYTACYEPENGWWNPYNEIDVEFSRWGNPANDLGQFVVQPWDGSGNIERFEATFTEGEVTSHAFRWLPDRLEFRSWRGGSTEETSSPLIHSWSYDGVHLPRPDQPRVHINLWFLPPGPSSDQEVVFEEFRFEPAPDPDTSLVPDGAQVDPVSSVSRLSVAPNPFRERAPIRFSLEKAGPASLVVFDVRGRRVRTLVDRVFASGVHLAEWYGLSTEGEPVVPGIYFLQLRTADSVETQRLVLAR